MRSIAVCGLVFAVLPLHLLAVPAPQTRPPVEPTQEQLDAAIEAYAEFGAEYDHVYLPGSGRRTDAFKMPPETGNAQLVGLPDLPFPFGLFAGSY